MRAVGDGTFNSAPPIAIVVPAYNAAPYLLDALRSILTQSVPRFECVIVDDGSTDATNRIAAAFCDEQDALDEAGLATGTFTLIGKPTNTGVARTINLGVTRTSAPWIMACGADDRLDRTYCARLLAAAESHPGARVAYCDIAEFGISDGRPWHPKDYEPGLLATENCIPGVAIFRRELYDAVGGLPEDFPYGGEDWAFWVKAEQLGLLDPPPVRVAGAWYHHRRHTGSLTARSIVPHIDTIRAQIRAISGTAP